MDIPRLDPISVSRLDASRSPQPSTTPVNAAQWEQALNAQRLQTDRPARLNLAEVVIQQEKQTASAQPLSYYFPARLSVPETATATPTAVAAVSTETQPTSVATNTPSSAATETMLPLDEITKQDGLLQRADVHFDSNSNRWSAEWPSPRPFHYGMVLKPTLAQFIKDGQSFSFQTGENQTQTISNHGGEIVVSNAASGQESVLDSQGLRRLLTNKIKAAGFELYLTQTGSLVLATTGNVARSMASVR